MKFIFNSLLFALFIFLFFVGYQAIEKGKTVADATDTVINTISGFAKDGKTELAKTLLERDLKIKIKNEVFDSYNRVKCFSNSEYGTSCKIYNLIITSNEEEIDFNVDIYNIFSIIQLTETRTGIFDLDTKIKLELNSSPFRLSNFITANDAVSFDKKRRLFNEIIDVLNDHPYIEILVKTKEYKYDDVLANIVITLGAKSLKATINTFSKLSEVAINSIEEIINNQKNIKNILGDIYRLDKIVFCLTLYYRSRH